MTREEFEAELRREGYEPDLGTLPPNRRNAEHAALVLDGEITLTCGEESFEGTGVFLLGAVLERFFAKHVSINSFTETALRTLGRGEIMRWRTRIGQRPTL